MPTLKTVEYILDHYLGSGRERLDKRQDDSLTQTYRWDKELE